MSAPDPHWPSASSLLVDGDGPVERSHGMVSLLGAHTYATSLTPRSDRSTPAAVRAALSRYSTWSFEDQVDLADAILVHDRGDITQPDTDEGRATLDSTLDTLFANFWILLGGDNALTWSALSSLARGRLGDWGLITLDAHLDMRAGRSNGSPVRQLLDEGLSGPHVVQVGLADFSNSTAYARDAREAGVSVIARHEFRTRSVEEICDRALEVAGAGDRPIYVDVDMDVCDRATVPGCPAAAPGGLSADELRRAVRHLCAHPQVHAIDVTEIDVARDTPDERTVRLAALVVLEALAGYVRRRS